MTSEGRKGTSPMCSGLHESRKFPRIHTLSIVKKPITWIRNAFRLSTDLTIKFLEFFNSRLFSKSGTTIASDKENTTTKG